MSNIVLFEKAESLVLKQEALFNDLAAGHKVVAFKREAQFSLQILKSNSYMLSVAAGNMDSLKNAVLNVAAVGLSLSPVEKLAYLVPRGKAICLDISYFGLIKVATDSQAIKWAVAELVYEQDEFFFNGHGREPTHKFNPFQKDRGAIIGAYSLAKTFNDEWLCTMMSIDEVYKKHRAKSESFAKNSGPWKTDEGEMIKKTLIRRGCKFWPKSSTRDDRFSKAISAMDEAAMMDIAAEERDVNPVSEDLAPKLEEMKNLLTAIGRTEEAYIPHMARVHKRTIESLGDLTAVEIDQSLVELYGLFKKQEAKAAQEAKAKENEPAQEELKENVEAESQGE